MITPLKLGNKDFAINIIQGPLAGVSCAPFRLLTSKYGQPAFTCTEMISCKTLIHQPKFAHRRFINKDPEEGPVCYQLAASEPNELAQATQIVTDHGANLIDLNCGCPVKKIRAKGSGSSLLSDPAKLYKMLYALKHNTHLPVSVKIRVEGVSDEKFNQEIAKVISDSGVDFLIVHGRHWTERYDIPCRYEQIQFFVQALTIPVIGNGDIACIDSLKRMFATGCAGVMISRAGVGQPWLVKKLIAQMQQKIFLSPSPQEIGTIFIEHVARLVDFLENEHLAVLQARKFGKYYAREIANKIDFCIAINACKTLAEIKNMTQLFFGTIIN